MIARNNGPVSVFKSNQKGGANLTVRLRGTKGNATAVGARLSLEFASGKIVTSEVYAGGGYLSQSSPVISFAIPKGETVAKLHVVWPDGSKAERSLESGDREVAWKQD